MDDNLQNPWRSIWTRPRETIESISAANPNRSLWLLAWIYGFCSLMNLFQSISIGENVHLLLALLLAILIAPFLGYAAFAIWSLVVMGIGKCLGGKGNFLTIRAAFSWSCVPLLGVVGFWLVLIALFGKQVFIHFPENYLLTSLPLAILFAILIGKVVLAVWSLVIYLNALSEVQKYSILRAIFNVIFSAFIMGFIMWVLLNCIVLRMGS